MSTITVEPELKLALERRAAEAGVSLGEWLRRVVEPAGLASRPHDAGAATHREPKQGSVGDALAELFERIPVPPVDLAKVRTDDEVTAEFKRDVAAAINAKARREGLR